MTSSSVSTRIAFVGAGNIATPYAESVARHSELALVGVFDIDASKRAEFAQVQSIHDYQSLDDLVADGPDIVVNLTSAPFHYATTRDLIERGVTVFSEKPLALHSDQAQELVEFADARGVRLACAPSLWLGEAELRAAAAVRAGTIGTVRLINAEVNQGRIETWHPVPFSFYQVGPVVDAGVYPLTYLTAIFGPIRTVSASSALVLAHRTTQADEPFTLTTPDVWQFVAEFASGPMLRLSCTFYVDSATQPRTIDFHGDLGSLRLDDWIQPGSGIQHAEYGQSFSPYAEPDASLSIDWSIGVLDLARALKENRPHRTSAQHAAHVVEVLNAVTRSADEGIRVDVRSTFPSLIDVELQPAVV
ncbi:hypothetical protein B7R22_02460 [Subtercola boreus]|uniref:Oxidoreductase n=1 Tax=Subtercola boreus TaxID=120213 RepID=A0A3E0W6G9_9MICO|nr:Gfo/Idh/MocA family oxidoreductase [Subtercola boreus]RFA16737.1 hypothetical protein B7R22_02460 [Subtercola boreus]